MVCKKCGRPLVKNAKFCTYCGYRIEIEMDNNIDAQLSNYAKKQLEIDFVPEKYFGDEERREATRLLGLVKQGDEDAKDLLEMLILEKYEEIEGIVQHANESDQVSYISQKVSDHESGESDITKVRSEESNFVHGEQNSAKVIQNDKQNSNKRSIIILVSIMVIAIGIGVAIKHSRINKARNGLMVEKSTNENIQSGESDKEIALSQSEEQESQENEGTNDSSVKSEKNESEENVSTQKKKNKKKKSEYLLPDSDSKYLKMKDLKKFSAMDCKIARNELYARHGRKFVDEALQKHFNSCSWYHGTIEPDDFNEAAMFNQYEIANRDLILKYEAKKGYR